MSLSDAFYVGLCVFIAVVSLRVLRSGPERAAWRRVVGSVSGLGSMSLLAVFLLIGLADSVHLAQTAGSGQGASILDELLRFVSDRGDPSTNPVAAIMLEQSFKGVRSAWLVGLAGLVAWLPLTILAGVYAGLAGGLPGRGGAAACAVFDAIPTVLLLVVLVFVAQPLIAVVAEHFPGPTSASAARRLVICAILGFVRTPALCRQVQARTARFMASDAVAAARCVGVSDAQLVRTRLLPEIVALALMALATAFPVLILVEALLSYLGMGLDPVTRSLGTVLSDALALAATEPGGGDVLLAALVPLGLMVAAASLFAFSVHAAFGRARR